MMAEVTIVAAFLAGVVSFLSPCVLPLVPPYLTYLAGATAARVEAEGPAAAGVTGRTVLAAFVFVLGFSTVFVLLGAAASTLGGVLRAHANTLATIAGVAIIGMGLHFLGLFRLPFLMKEWRSEMRMPVGLGGAYAMGLAFAFGWTPCIGPVLATILAVAAVDTTVAQGMGLLAIYSLGLGVPFILAAFAAGPFARFLGTARSRVVVVEKVMGALLVLTGIAFLAGWLTTASFWILEAFPALGRLG